MRKALRRHVEVATSRLDPVRYWQEPAYVAGLVARLDGVVYQGRAGRFEILSTVVTDRGFNSAESWSGADFGIVGRLRSAKESIDKAIMGQAKKASLADLTGEQREGFQIQCERISKITPSVLGLEVPIHSSSPVLVREIDIRWPRRAIAMDDSANWHPPTTVGAPQDLTDYLLDRFLACKHGTPSEAVIKALADSRLSHLLVSVETAG